MLNSAFSDTKTEDHKFKASPDKWNTNGWGGVGDGRL